MDKLREKLMGLIDIGSGCPDGMNPFGDSCESCKYYESTACHLERLADYLIANGVTMQEWIPVTERLPENDVMVIGYTPCDGYMFIGYYHEEPKYDWKVWRIVTAMRSTKVMKKKVTHWLPLPKPPKEG